ncbi:MAG: prolyl oligopeptidase family serine peptidase [Proteobacteria bacterium]|nr:prolyl oligopeptidase family serine peptidase [Pseudomonadota bacterium]
MGLAGCGSDTESATVGTSTDRGTLVYNPPFRIASLTAADFGAQLSAQAAGASLLAVAGQPACGVDFYHLQYNTVGGTGEKTTASGALLVPTGTAAGCSGPRPIVLYAHGTQTDKTANLADITNTNNAEGALIAAVFAAHGFIVVAPNYAGYDTSTLPYHPFLNGDQQSKDMIDALAAARSALPQTMSAATSDNGKLFISGYSQGGYVAMATHKALQAAGVTVTASAPMSGPYALEAFGDAIFYGSVDIGSTVFGTMVASSYQHSYGNLYTTPTQVFEAAYAANVAADILPSATPVSTLFSTGKLPQTALFNSTTPVTGNAQLDAALAVPANPVFALGFGASNLITNDYRLSYVLDAVNNPDGAVPTPTQGVPTAAAPANTLRQDLKTNDMRSWAPHAPMLLCGGDQDPTVFFSVNTGTMQAYWSALPAGLLTVLDVNAAPNPASPFAPLQVAFQATLQSLAASGGQEAVVENYHTTVAPFCTVAARGFFSQF